MGIAIGTIVIVDGAILTWAVDASAGPSAQTIGYVLLGLGAITVVLSLVFWSSWAGRGYFARYAASGRSRLESRRLGHP